MLSVWNNNSTIITEATANLLQSKRKNCKHRLSWAQGHHWVVRQLLWAYRPQHQQSCVYEKIQSLLRRWSHRHIKLSTRPNRALHGDVEVISQLTAKHFLSVYPKRGQPSCLWDRAHCQFQHEFSLCLEQINSECWNIAMQSWIVDAIKSIISQVITGW